MAAEWGGFLTGLTPITRVSGAFAVMIGVLAAYWLLRVGREARLGWVPRVAWWSVPGLALLLYAPVLDVPALFGIGAALLLIAEFWPGAFAPARQKPSPAWPLVGVALGAVLTVGVVRAAPDVSSVVVGTALILLLLGTGGLLASVLYPVATRLPGFGVRWQTAQSPELPDLTVTLTEHGAQLRNVSRRTLNLAGWSPASVNGWLRLRDETGQPLNTLRAGQTAFLPLDGQESGVRVWYVAGSTPATPLLFRADWTPRVHANYRVLN
ncbi:hypothetical protein [Deinococcus puniceus]|uniref:Uncharacterized protein n=1 Tax=Deinococcus puniceus TaxID=1182568 RepID=A0A172T8W8_9DEIO|nr:hypothetical protein [Deinococcus puniceus]ANE43441.1 hypothetical protein SU48_06295 [Deinococcus puniceus]